MGLSRIAALFAAATMVCASAPAQALTFASFGAVDLTNNLAWTNTGFSVGSLTNIPNDSHFEGGVTDVSFSFLEFGLPGNLDADFDLSATSTSPAVVAFGVLLAQPGISGSFHFTYDGPDTVIDGFLFLHGANLLSGTFTNAFISGIVGGDAASIQSELYTTGPITFTSDFLTFQDPCCGDETMSLNLNGVTPTLHINAQGDTLASFDSNAGGEFAADVVAETAPHGGGVPEPATWTLMLIGFGAAGAALRRRARSQSVAAA
jgi:hypothetical protein